MTAVGIAQYEVVDALTMNPPFNQSRRRLQFGAIHLLISLVLAGLAFILVFFVWYPEPYWIIAGGLGLFWLLVVVDAVVGPALTLVVASPKKDWKELKRDLAVIGVLQLMALCYGLYTIASARPVHVAFEVDRFRVVTAADIESERLAKAPASLRTLPWTGPTLIAAVKPDDPAELMRATELGLAGIDLSMNPSNWREYAAQAAQAWSRAAKVSLLVEKFPSTAAPLAALAERAGMKPDDLRFLPLVARRATWTVVLADGGKRVLGYLPVDGFL